MQKLYIDELLRQCCKAEAGLCEHVFEDSESENQSKSGRTMPHFTIGIKAIVAESLYGAACTRL